MHKKYRGYQYGFNIFKWKTQYFLMNQGKYDKGKNSVKLSGYVSTSLNLTLFLSAMQKININFLSGYMVVISCQIFPNPEVPAFFVPGNFASFLNPGRDFFRDVRAYTVFFSVSLRWRHDFP